MSPLAPFVAELESLTVTVALKEPVTGDRLILLEKGPVDSFDTSYPDGAVTTTLAVRDVPETKTVWVDEATPGQLEKGCKLLVTLMDCPWAMPII
jgi:hypothetical protein